MLKRIKLHHVGPSPELEVEFAERMNIFTGDNGLGKTFLLDMCWYGLTRSWAGNPALPDRGAKGAEALFELVNGKSPTAITASYKSASQQWVVPKTGGVTSSLVVYARVDGGFSVWDPARARASAKRLLYSVTDLTFLYRGHHFTPEEVWDGKRILSNDSMTTSAGVQEEQRVSNGLIVDWATWQYKNDDAFKVLSKVLEGLSPSALEVIRPAKPRKIQIVESRDIPFIELPYGEVPITHASAAMKRIASLAYMLAWVWKDHVDNAQIADQAPAGKIVLIFDEVEGHLHPQWQRSIIPSLLGVAESLDRKMKTQIIATTHAPLVLASIEPHFDKEKDSLSTFVLSDGDVKLEEYEWAKQGDILNWLATDTFGNMTEARSVEAEHAIKMANAFMDGDKESLPEGMRTKEQIHKELQRVLAGGQDPFWPRWIVSYKGLDKK